MAELGTADAARVLALASQVEMALVRRDPVVGPLLAQAARAGDGLPGGDLLKRAAHIARTVDLTEHDAARKLVQALVRVVVQESQAGLLA